MSSDAYVTLDGWNPNADDFPAAALSNFLYPPLVSCSVRTTSFSPRAIEGSPTVARNPPSTKPSVFNLTALSKTPSGKGSSSNAKDTAANSMLPSTYEQQKNRCRWWHHEFHRLLEEEVKEVHKRQIVRQNTYRTAVIVAAPPQQQSVMPASSGGGGTEGAGASTTTTTAAASPLAPAAPLAATTIPAPDEGASETMMLGEETKQEQLLNNIFQQHPVPLAMYGSVLPSAPKSTQGTPALMTMPMSSFLGEFEAACAEGAEAVLDYIAKRGTRSSAPESAGGEVTRFLATGSRISSPRHDSTVAGSPFGTRRHRDPNSVVPLEDPRGGDTPNFFTYKHMIYNVLHLMKDETRRVFGCPENLEKIAASEVRGLSTIVDIAISKGSLTLQDQTKVGARNHAASVSDPHGATSGSGSNLASISVPLVCLVKVHGVSMFVIAQPTATPSESVIAGPSHHDGAHIPSTLRHTSVLTTLCNLLRVPSPTFFLTDQHKRLISQIPAIGHPELTVVLANKLSREQEAANSGMIGQLHQYAMPFIPVSKLRSQMSKRRPFETHSHIHSDSEGESSGGDDGRKGDGLQSTDVLIIQNVARFVSPPSDTTQSTLMPHIITPQRPKAAPSPLMTALTTALSPGNPLDLTVGYDGPLLSTRHGSLHAINSFMLSPQSGRGKSAVSPATPRLDFGNRYLHVGRSSSLYNLLHPNFVLTLPYDSELPRSVIQAPPTAQGNEVFAESVKAATTKLLNEQVDRMIQWMLTMMDSVPSIGTFVDDFDGSVLKEIMHAWGVNLRYLGLVHRKLCDALIARAPSALQTTTAALQQAVNAATARMTGGSSLATAAASLSVASSMLASQGSRSLRSKQHSNIKREDKQPGLPTDTNSKNAMHHHHSHHGMNRGNAVTGLTQTKGVGGGGRLFLNRSSPLDLPSSNEITAAVRSCLQALNVLLSADLDKETPPIVVPPPALNPQPPSGPNAGGAGSGTASLARRVSALTSSQVSSSPASKSITAPVGGGPSSPRSSTSPTKRNTLECVRSPLDRSPVEHLLFVVRCEMIARSFRSVLMEHMRLSHMRKCIQSSGNSDFDLPSVVPTATGRSRGSDLLGPPPLPPHANSDALRSPNADNNVLSSFESPLPPLMSAQSNVAMIGQSTSSKLYQKLKDLNAVLEEKNNLYRRHTDENFVTRSIDRIMTMDTVYTQRANDSTPRPSIGASVLSSEYSPPYEADGLFVQEAPDAEKQRIAELLSLLVLNGSTSASAQFWQQVMMSDMWLKFGTFVSGSTAKRSDVQKIDMMLVLNRVSVLCGIEFSPAFNDQIKVTYPPLSGSTNVSAFASGHNAGHSTLSRNRRILEVPITHRAIAGIVPLLRSTLRRRKPQLDLAPPIKPLVPSATEELQKQLGVIPTGVNRNELLTKSIADLETELKRLQDKRFLRSGKKFKEGMGDAATSRELVVLDGLMHLYRHGGAIYLPFLQLAKAQWDNADLVMFYHSVARVWKKANFDGICYRPCGSCGILFNASISQDMHLCRHANGNHSKVDADELSIGISDGRLPSELIKASSSTPGYEAMFARKCVTASCWKPEPRGHDHYIEFVFGTTREITALEIQGDGVDSFVTSFQLIYTLDYKEAEPFSGRYYRRDDNPKADPPTGFVRDGKGEELFARPFNYTTSSNGSGKSMASPRRVRHNTEENGSGTFSSEPVSPLALNSNVFGSIAWTQTVRVAHKERSPAGHHEGESGSGNKLSSATARSMRSDTAQAGSSPSLAPAFSATFGQTQRSVRVPPTNASSKNPKRPDLRPTFLKGNSDAKSTVRIQFLEPFRCSTLKFVIGNEDASTAAMKIELFYASRHMPSVGRGGCERIAVNHVDWNSLIPLSTFADGGGSNGPNSGGATGIHSSKVSRRILALKEKHLLERILAIENEIVDSSEETKRKSLPHECVLVRSSSEIGIVFEQLLQLLLSWGIERSSDVQLTQFNLVRYALGEVKLFARCGQLDLAASRADRLMKKLDDIFGPLGFGGVALLVAPLAYLMSDALSCAGILPRHVDDFYHMVEWGAAVRHPLLIQLVAVLIDAAGVSSEEDRVRVGELCHRLCAEGRLSDIPAFLKAQPVASTTKLPPLPKHDTPDMAVLEVSDAARKVFQQIAAQEMFLRMEGESVESSLFPKDPEDVKRRLDMVDALLDN